MLSSKTKLIASHNRYLQNEYEHSFYEAANYLHDVSNLLNKVKLTKLPSQNINLFAQIWHTSATAHDNFSSLPYNHNLIAKVLKYLTQTSDFAYSMMNKSIDNEQLTQEDWDKVNQLEKYASDLSNEFEMMFTSSNVSQKINWNKLIDETATSPNALAGSIQNVSKQFQEYGELIYDGPFSDHIQNIKPQKLDGKEEIDKMQGLEIAKKILFGQGIKNIEYSGENTTKKSMVTYSYSAQNDLNQQVYLQITKKGGYPLLMVTEPSKEISENQVSNEDAIKIAKKFLAENNFDDMKESYYEQFENDLTINFAPYVNNVIMYPDLVKVKVNLVTGKIIGFEALGYLTMNHDRQINIAKISDEELLDLIPNDFQVQSIKNCVIPLDSKKEASCYEVNGNFNGHKFIIYINNATGKFEKIYCVVANERGTLVE